MGKFGMNAWIVLIFLLSILPRLSALADTGPKPSMEFQFVQGTGVPEVSITSGTLFECEQSDCRDAEPLKQLGPQGFHCEAKTCSALAYGFSRYQKIEIQFTDGVIRKSNVFQKTEFQASYEVTIQQTDLVVKPKIRLGLFSPYTYVLVCGLCLLGAIIFIVVIVLLVRRSRRK